MYYLSARRHRPAQYVCCCCHRGIFYMSQSAWKSPSATRYPRLHQHWQQSQAQSTALACASYVMLTNLKFDGPANGGCKAFPDFEGNISVGPSIHQMTCACLKARTGHGKADKSVSDSPCACQDVCRRQQQAGIRHLVIGAARFLLPACNRVCLRRTLGTPLVFR